MKRTRLSLLALVAAGALTLSACATGGTDAGDGGEASTPEPAPTFEEGTTMATLAEAGLDHDRHEVRPAAVRPDGGHGRAGGLRRRDRQDHRGELGISEDDIEWVESVSANREPFIQNGEVDIVIATYTINDKRKEVVSFAGPYYMAGQSILTLADNEDIESEDDLVGQPVCSVTGSTPAANIDELGAEVVLTGTYSKCLEPLRNGTVVAVSTDNVILAGLAAQNEGEFKVVGKPFTEEPYGIGLALEDTEFRNWINDVLEDAYEDGSYEEAWNSTAGTVLEFVEPPAVDRY